MPRGTASLWPAFDAFQLRTSRNAIAAGAVLSGLARAVFARCCGAAALMTTYSASGLTPTKMVASGGGPIGCAALGPVVMNPLENGSCATVTWYFPTALIMASTKWVSLPATWMPSAMGPPPCTAISHPPLVEKCAFLKASTTWNPNSAPSTSSAYEAISTDLLPNSDNDFPISSIWSGNNLRGAICAFNAAISYFCRMLPTVSTTRSAIANANSHARAFASHLLPVSFSQGINDFSNLTPRQTKKLQTAISAPNMNLAMSHWSKMDIATVVLLSIVAFSHFCLAIYISFFRPSR